MVEEWDEDSSSQRNIISAMRLHVLEMSGKAVLTKSGPAIPKQDVNKDNTNKHATMKLWNLIDSKRMLSPGEIALPSQRASIGYPIANSQP